MSLSLIKYPIAGGGSGTVNGANDGLTLNGSTVQLGQVLGAAGNPAALLENREIPLSNFTLTYSNGASQLTMDMLGFGDSYRLLCNTFFTLGSETNFVTIQGRQAITGPTDFPILQLIADSDTHAGVPQNFSGVIEGYNIGNAGPQALLITTTGTNDLAGGDIILSTGLGNNSNFTTKIPGNFNIGFIPSGTGYTQAASVLITGGTYGAPVVPAGVQFISLGTTGNFQVHTDGTTYDFASVKFTSNDNLIFGRDITVANITGNGNVGLGINQTLQALTSGNQNVAIGDFCMTAITSGVANVAIGAGALQRLTTNSLNIGIGNQSFQWLDVQEGNIALGNMSAAAIPGNFNIAIGSIHGSRFDPSSTWGSDNIFIGDSVNLDTNVGDNNIVIGTTSNSNGTTNTTIIGASINTTLSNVAIFGSITQNILIAPVAVPFDNGIKLQINGALSIVPTPLAVTPVNGVLETDGTNLYFTVGGVRKTVTLV